MPKKLEIHNFHNLTISNANVTTHPLKYHKEVKEESLSVVFVREPYAYFDYLMYDYLHNKRSILFTQDIINHMKEFSNENFLHWFDTLNFLPFYNPQTFQLDSSKRTQTAIENLKRFDYVVPYDEIDIFLKNISSNIVINIHEEQKLLFSLRSQKEHELINNFIDKDIQLYKQSMELWELIKQNDFKPLRSLIKRKKIEDKATLQHNLDLSKKYKGVAGQISKTSIAGWVYHTEEEKSVTLEIYKNDIYLCTAIANTLRTDLKNKQIHLTGECGFEVIFEDNTFARGDNIEVKILPHKISLPLGRDIKDFLAI